MNNAKKILINCILISCLLSWYSCSLSNKCDLYVGDNACDAELRPFSREVWHEYPFEASKEVLDSIRKSNLDSIQKQHVDSYIAKCIRESMICDLTQNVIPLGTPYEKVMSLLGNGQRAYGEIWSKLPTVLRNEDYKYKYLYKENLSELFAKKKVLIYTSGGNAYGHSYLLIIFENEKVIGFARTVEDD